MLCRSRLAARREDDRGSVRRRAGCTRSGLGVRLRASPSSSRRCCCSPSTSWNDGEKIPADGGCVVAVEPHLAPRPAHLAHFVYETAGSSRFLAKDAMFEVPVLGWIVRSAGQIPVYRLTTDASQAFARPCDAVQRGRVRGRLPRGHDHPGAGPVADDAARPVRPGSRWRPGAR